MRTSTKKLAKLVVASCVLSLVTMFSADAAAHTAMKFCTRWLTTYWDSGNPLVDYLEPTIGDAFYPAPYTYAQVVDLDASKVVWEGELDYTTCAPLVEISSDTHYKFRQATKAQRSNRRIYVNPDTGDWGQSYVYLNSYFTTSSSLTPNYHYTHVFQPNWSSPKANVMPIACRILNYYSTFAYPDYTHTYVRTDSSHCFVSNAYEGGAYYAGAGHVCLRGSGATGWDDATTYKFLVGHVLGHRLADANSGPLNSTYGHEDASGVCKCSYGITHGGTNHCMTSREPIFAAESEGYAHFFSSTVFNSRNTEPTEYMQYQDSFTCGIEEGVRGMALGPYTPPVALPAGFRDSETQCDSWMENSNMDCDPGPADKGVELDWMHFLWELWTTDNEYTVADINSIWQDTTDGHWDGLNATVVDLWSVSDPGKVDRFVEIGDQAGVNHYAP
jgi:hypothetical protein